MGNFRFLSIELATNRKNNNDILQTKEKISDIFGELTFDRKSMQQYLSKIAFQKVLNAVEKGEKIEREIADEIASGMKSWALSMGATHYTHWFQPLTGYSAEKHDSFFTLDKQNRAIEYFDGSSLVQQEPDASSFPSGGIRSTFEARGYTAWDPTSPAFIIDNTLCIPTIFVSYTGEALDYKAPLLKTLHFLDKTATEVVKIFSPEVNSVKATLGIEQEYFLIDEALFFARPDIVLTGRTLFGHSAAKDQQLEDNYFGSIPERIMKFMKDIEYQAYRLGIPLRTRHNEVAPNQFECAPLFEDVNLAVDHNILLMDIMQKTARRHHFRILFHEKPFAGINGSGKHNNFSLMTDTGDNLLSPGKNPISNLKFLTFLLNIIKAVNDYPDLLRASIATASNDLRLGGNEAPPAIMSVFLGEHITNILNSIKNRNYNDNSENINKRQETIDIARVPEILLDNTDRNRTSPFAFTGNKFEFRAVGSMSNSAAPMIALLTIIGNQLKIFLETYNSKLNNGQSKEEALYDILKNYVIETEKIRFDGNNYSQFWIEEAEKRGLRNIKSTPEALDYFIDPEIVKIFENSGVLSYRELHARMEIKFENYIKKIQIESRTLGDLAINHIIPVAISYQNVLIENVKGLKKIFDIDEFHKKSSLQMKNISEISEHINNIISLVDKMTEQRRASNKIENSREKAIAYLKNVLPFMEEIRKNTDALELMIDDELWTLPKYRELLFIN
jgi:glutamine synthetase